MQNGKDIPVLKVKTETKISHKVTGKVYANDEEWKNLGIEPSQIRRDVKLIVPRLDLLAKTK